jgi:hypothetical protein
MGNAAVSIVEPLNAALKEFGSDYRYIAIDLVVRAMEKIRSLGRQSGSRILS